MKKVVLICMCILILPLFAEQAEIESLAREFYRLNSPMEKIKEDMAGQMDMLSNYMGGKQLGDEDSPLSESDLERTKNLISKLMDDFMDYDALEDLSVSIIVTQYSVNELESIIAFLKSPAGQSYLMNSRIPSNYLTQATKTYFEQKSQDENWIMSFITTLFEEFGLNDESLDGYQSPSDENGDWDDWGDWAVSDTIDGNWWADSDSVDYDYSEDTWEDYWNTPAPVSITGSGKILDSLVDIQYVMNKLMPAFKQIYTQLDAYTEEYGGYPNELNWKKIKKVKGFDLEYEHDSSFLRATSNAKYRTPGIEVIYYLFDSSLWISIPHNQ